MLPLQEQGVCQCFLSSLPEFVSGSVFFSIDMATNSKQREFLFNATDDAALAKLVLKVKAELDQLGDLLNSDSAAFCNTKWKVRMPVTPEVSGFTWLNIISWLIS